MMVSMEEEAANGAGSSMINTAGAGASTAAASDGEARQQRRPRWWYAAGAVLLGVAMVVVAGAAGGFNKGGRGRVGDHGSRAEGQAPLSAFESWAAASSSSDSPEAPPASLSKQQQAPTPVPSISLSRNATTGKAPSSVPNPNTLLGVLQALQQEADKKHVTTDYFGNEVPNQHVPGAWAHLTGAPTPTIIDDGAPVCHVENSVELRQAIVFKSCPLIVLAPVSNDEGEYDQDRDDDDPLVMGEVADSPIDGAYSLFTEIVIAPGRRVTLQGDPVMMPLIDCQLSVRCFRVKAGGRLDARHVRMNTGKGAVEARVPGLPVNPDAPGPLANKVNIVRGGTVLYEPGAVGGYYLSCMFLGDEGTTDEVRESIERSFGVLGMRIYGGHFFMAGGRLDFVGCLFFDYEILTPMTDRLRFGDKIFMLAGEVYMTGCVCVDTSLFGLDLGVGLYFHIQGGAFYVTASTLMVNNGISLTGTIGQAIFVGGGLFICTASNAMLNSAIENFNGFGAFTTIGGVQIITASGIQDFYAVLGAFGLGFDLGLAAGVVVTTNVGINQFLGLVYAGLLGGFSCNLAGIYIAEHTPFISNVGQMAEAGGGGYTYTAAGLNSFHFCPLYTTAGTWAAFMDGALIGLASGWLVWIYCPIVTVSGIEVFFGGGGVVHVGAGAAVMGRSPLIELIALLNHHSDFHIMGSCEPYTEAWADGPITLYIGAQGCHPEEEAPEGIYDDPQGYTNKTGRVGGEWISKLERYRHENRERRQEKKHPNGTGGHSGGGGGGHRARRRAQRQRWLQRRERDGGRGVEEWVDVRRGVQAEEEEEEQAGGGVTHAPLGASFAEPAFLGFKITPRRHRDRALLEGEEEAALNDVTEDQVVAAVFPSNVLEGMRVVQEPIKAMKRRILNGDGSLIDPVTIRMESTPVGFCGVCGVDGVDGPGAPLCAVQRDCDDEFTGFASLALAEAAPMTGQRLFGDGATTTPVASVSPVIVTDDSGDADWQPPVAAAPLARTRAVQEGEAGVLEFPSQSAFDALPHSTRRSLQDSLSAPVPVATTTTTITPSPPSTSSQERFVLTAKIDVGTDPGYPRLNASQLADAVYAALGRNGSDPLHPIVGSEAVQVQVFSAGVDDPVFSSWYPELKEQGTLQHRGSGDGAGGEDFDVQRFKAVILSTSRLQARRTLRALGQDPGARIRHLQEEEDGVVERKKSRRHLQEEEGDEVVEGGKSRRLQEEDGVVEGPDGEMLQGDSEGWGAVMAAFLQQEAGLEGVRAVGVGFERSVYIPPYDTELFLQEADPGLNGGRQGGSDMGSYAVVIVDPAAEAFPLVHGEVGYKKEYAVRLSGFPADALVTVQALRISEEEAEAVRLMATVTTDKEGRAAFKWRFFPLGFPEGNYEIKANVLQTGAFGLSPLYSLSSAGPRRRLVGPRMWV